MENLFEFINKLKKYVPLQLQNYIRAIGFGWIQSSGLESKIHAWTCSILIKDTNFIFLEWSVDLWFMVILKMMKLHLTFPS